MKNLLRPAISLFVLLSIVTGVFYPLLVTGVARVAFPAAASGSLIVREGKPIGSELIGQNFTEPKYFWGRPSATAPQPYNAAASSGSNLGPLNPALAAAVKARIDALRAADPGNPRPVPIDLVTASASGLDPHISPAAADYQVERVARSRQLDPQAVRQLISQHSEGLDLGVLGEPRVHVLRLNLALDAIER
ncbi:MAG: potassium-transporting ATPase subunit KdpC [Accumulibacter sp.]|jgi:K+-transporting ATPase ATPase C chain|uniref:potassium-transporting ATPase subunit KdpC n=1 Tax=Accumulibacter sp. TaxID=2053492 RepID=UPI002FC2EE97